MSTLTRLPSVVQWPKPQKILMKPGHKVEQNFLHSAAVFEGCNPEK